MLNKIPIAHVKLSNQQFVIHDLASHLIKVAKRAAEFAELIGADWAEMAGRWHDLEKYRPAFQVYIKRDSGYDPEAHVRW